MSNQDSFPRYLGCLESLHFQLAPHGTFGIMLPIAVPLMAQVPGLEGACIAAVLGGGVFGDHCSPISDTTMIASLASGSDHIAHVNTQLPYAMLVALVSVGLYALAGLILL